MSAKYDLLVNIGLDFGSSTTKVCYRLQGDRVDKKSAVTFSRGNISPDGLLRNSEIYVSGDLKYMGWKKFSDCKSILFLKTSLIDNHLQTEKCEMIKAMCAYYLASVLALSKQYIERTEAKLLELKKVLWIVNFGLPIDQDERNLEKAYEEIAHVAVLRYDEAYYYPYVSLARWRDLYAKSKEESLTNVIYYLTPELLAEVIDVFEDPEVNEGISIIIDIGSATVDIAVVELDRHFSAESYLVNFISAKVGALGVDNTVKHIKSKKNELPKSLIKNALLEKSHFNQTYNLLKDLSLKVDGLDEYGESLLNKFRGLLAETCLKAKNTSMRNYLQSMDNIPLYLLGGGSCYHWYNFWPQDVYNNRLKKCNIPKFSPQKLYHQQDIAMLNENNYQRFRVASGLTATETMLRISGYPWHFQTNNHPLREIVKDHEWLEAIQKEKYGN